jgi:hypothetical protein
MYVHHVPGRLRIRCTNLKRNPALAVSVRTALEGKPGVSQVTIEQLTGSLKVLYSPALTEIESIKSCLREYSLPSELPPAPSRRALRQSEPPPQHFTSTILSQIATVALQTAVKQSVTLLVARLL